MGVLIWGGDRELGGSSWMLLEQDGEFLARMIGAQGQTESNESDELES